MMEHEFHGCKVALLIGERLLIIQRDDKPDIPFPNLWDFPGGGREGDESAEETLFREVFEEVGLTLEPTHLIWKRRYTGQWAKDVFVWFYVAQLPAGSEDRIVFGNEGQGWRLVHLDEFLSMDGVVPSFQHRVRDWLSDR